MHEMSALSPQGLRRELGLRDLVLFSLAGIISPRWLGAAAHTGPGAISLWVLAAAFFLLPSALAIARLTAKYPDQGGLYVWTKRSFGDWHGFLCFWIYWLGLAFWFPSFLLVVTSISSYALGSQGAQLADSRWYTLPVALGLLWIALGCNIVGLRFGKWVDNIGGCASYAVGLLLVIASMLVWLKRGPATPMTFLPGWDWERLNFWSQISYAMTGLELAPVLGGEIRSPERNLPRSAAIVAPLAAICYIAGTIALLVISPPEEISPLHGVPQTAAVAGSLLHANWLAAFATVLMLLGALGQLSVIGSVAARLPFVLGVDSYLPSALAAVHPRWHTPHIAIGTFGLIATGFLLLTQLGETVRAGYQIATDLMVISGFLPFVYIFLSAWKCGSRWSVGFGLSVTAVALASACVPTSDVRSIWLFELKLIGGTILLVLAARVVFLRAASTRFRSTA